MARLNELLVLVTGANGYLGQRIVSHLATVGGVRIRAASRAPILYTNSKNVEWIRIDWDDSSSVRSALRDVSVVVHLAGTSAKDSLHQPRTAFKVTVEYTSILARASSKMGISQFIFFSTCHVYCSPLVGIISEDTVPTNAHPYAANNFLAEQEVLSSSLRSKLNPIILRLSNVVGAPVTMKCQCWELVANDLCKQALEMGQIAINNGNSIRDFIDLRNITRLVEKIIFDDLDLYGTYNVTSSAAMSVRQLADLVANCCVERGLNRPRIKDGAPAIINDRVKITNNKLIGAGFSVNAEIKPAITEVIEFLSVHSRDNS